MRGERSEAGGAKRGGGSEARGHGPQMGPQERSPGAGGDSSRTRISSATFSLQRAGAAPEANEDAVLVSDLDGSPGSWTDFVAVVADGVGSSRNPATASRTAVNTWIAVLKHRFTERPGDLAAFDSRSFAQLMRECFAQAHHQVHRGAEGGTATAAGVCIQGDWLLAASVGDARIYRYARPPLSAGATTGIRGGRGNAQADGVHSPDDLETAAGELWQVTADQVDARGDPTDVLGGRSAAPHIASYAERVLQAGDWIVVCSDGLGKTVDPGELTDILSRASSPKAAVAELQRLAVERAVQDDVTAVLARIEAVGAPVFEPGQPLAPRDSGLVNPQRPAAIDEFQTQRATSHEPRAVRNESRAMSHEGSIGDRPVVEEVPVNLSPDAVALGDLDRRLSRLERTPAPTGLKNSDLVGITREFEGLDQRLSDLEAGRTGASRGNPLLWATAASLILGLLIGGGLTWLFGPHVEPGKGLRQSAGKAGESVAGFAIQLPADLLISLDETPTETGVTLRYRSLDGRRGVAVYSYADGGKPTLHYLIPKSVAKATPTTLLGDRSSPADAGDHPSGAGSGQPVSGSGPRAGRRAR